jgi:septum formation protein
MTVILASGSPRRRELITRLGIPFEVQASNVPERDARRGENPASYALELAVQKAQAVARVRPGDTIVAADTVVHLDGLLLGKPENAAAAVQMLSLLAGRTHGVTTGVVVVCGDEEHAEAETTAVTMGSPGVDALRAYAETGEPLDKAGGYGIQGLGGQLVVDIVGCYENVVGFPLGLVARLLDLCGQQVPVSGGLCTHFGPRHPWSAGRAQT